MAPKGFEALDIAIIVLAQCLTMGIGIYFALRANKTTTEYLLGNRNLHFLPVSISIAVSLYSSVLFLGFPAENYLYGGMYWLYCMGIAIGAILACALFIPVMQPLKLTSINRYLHLRYESPFIAILGTLSSVTLMIVYTGVVYFGPATALSAITGFPVIANIVMFGAFTCIYTAIGGIKAVIWTDVIQAALMVTSLIAVAVQAIILSGGINKTWEICKKGGRLDIDEISPDPRVRFTIWSLSIGVGFFDMNRYGLQQPAVQRYSSVPTLTKACLTVLITIPLVIGMISLTSISGLGMYAFYETIGCDPRASGQISNANQLVPHFVMNHLNIPGFPGILFAGLLSASLSTASSNINAAAANIYDDILRRYWPNIAGKHLLITKILVVILGAIATCITLVVSVVGGTLAQMTITFMSAVMGPVTAMFFMGVFFPFADWVGASTGGFIGFIFAMWMGFGSYSINNQRQFLDTTTSNCSSIANITTTTTHATISTTLGYTPSAPPENPLRDFYSVSYLWIAFFSFLVALTIGLVVSFLTGYSKKRSCHPKYFHPLIRKLLKMPIPSPLEEATLPDSKIQNGFTNLALEPDVLLKTKL